MYSEHFVGPRKVSFIEMVSYFEESLIRGSSVCMHTFVLSIVVNNYYKSEMYCTRCSIVGRVF